MAEREVRYCTTEDGIRIAYSVEGEGSPVLWLPNFVESFSVDHLNPWLHQLISSIGRGRMMIRYDPRGLGLSEGPVADFSLEGLIKDVEAVVQAGDPKDEKISLVGAGAGGHRAIPFAARHQGRVACLVLLNSWARLGEVWTRDALTAF